MLGKKDYLEFCEQLMKIEKHMEHQCLFLVKKIEDKTVVDLLRKIAHDEKRHEKIVNAIKKIITKEYE